jgi:aspartate aminotransferase-like enzyme
MMTPGPTEVHERVRQAMAQPLRNPDLDPAFFEFYRNTARKFARLIETRSDVLILCGEGILGLEAACASLIEPGDRVLCLDNGIFGRGFADFVRLYGGEPVFFTGDDRLPLDPDRLARFLETDHEFTLATLVHCETPSGLVNPVADLAPLLNRRGILTVVDAVSSIGGEEFRADDWRVDVTLGGSQKCLSAPPGLTMVSLSDAARQRMARRRRPIASFYCNLAVWQDWYARKWFPYTQPVADIHALDAALDRLLADPDNLARHRRLAESVRHTLTAAGLDLFPRAGWSNTVTAFQPPAGLAEAEIRHELLTRHNILLAGAFDRLAGKVIRIGHMGENCREDKLFLTFAGLDRSLRSLGFTPAAPMAETFARRLAD